MKTFKVVSIVGDGKCGSSVDIEADCIITEPTGALTLRDDEKRVCFALASGRWHGATREDAQKNP